MNESIRYLNEGKILVIHGPNMNMLGMRIPDIYGQTNLDEINVKLRAIAKEAGFQIVFFKSNCEGEIITRIQRAYNNGTTGILINAGAYAHTSLAIHDALTLRGDNDPFPYVEVHLSDPKQREPYRHFSFLEATAKAVFSGKHDESYYEGLSYLIAHLKAQKVTK